jgi:hypothetical protein
MFHYYCQPEINATAIISVEQISAQVFHYYCQLELNATAIISL